MRTITYVLTRGGHCNLTTSIPRTKYSGVKLTRNPLKSICGKTFEAEVSFYKSGFTLRTFGFYPVGGEPFNLFIWDFVLSKEQTSNE